MKLPKVKVVTNWCTPFQIHDRIIDQYVKDNTKLPFIFTTDKDYDFLVVFNDLNGYTPEVNRHCILGFIQEPPNHSFFDKNLGDKCSKVYTCADAKYYVNNSRFESFPCGMFYHMDGDVQDFFAPIEKTKSLSMVTSGIKGGFYDYRINMSRYLAGSGFCDVFGRGNRYATEVANKSDALLPYRFSVCMENGVWDGYISDKIIDAVMCGCVPIYVGAPDVQKHIPFAIQLQNYKNAKHAMQEIQHIVNTVEYFDILPQIDEWKFKFLRRYSILEKIKQFVQP